MKRNSRLPFYSGIIMIALIGCQKNHPDTFVNQTSNNNVKFALNKDVEKSFGSKWTQMAGVSSIQRTRVNDSISYYQILGNETNFNGFITNLNASIFEIRNSVSSMTLTLVMNNVSGEKKIVYQLDNITKTIFDVSNSTLVTDDYWEDKQLTARLAIVISIYDAISNPHPDTPIEMPNVGGCDRTIMSFSSSKSRSVSRNAAAAAGFIQAHPDCSLAGDQDTGCFWGDFVCVTTQGIHCTGAGCNVSYGSL